MPEPLLIQKLPTTNSSLENPIKNKNTAVLHNKKQSHTNQDTSSTESPASAVTLDIPENTIKQSRISPKPSKALQDSTAVNSNPDAPSPSVQDDQDTINCLKSDWLEEAEAVIAQRYGLTGDGANLSIVLDNTPEPYLASTNFEFGPDGKANNETLHIAVQTALPSTLPNGGEAPYYDDRVITHEMVHAIMGRTMDFQSLPIWFAEGTAEFIHGADERIALDLSRNGGGAAGATAIQNALGDGADDAWVSDSLHYSSATMAVRYLHKQIEAAGHSGGIKDLLKDLKDHPTENLDQALSHVSNYANTQAFITDYVRNGHGENFIHNLDAAGEFQNAVNGGDTGGIGGASADNGPVQTSKSVIPDTYDPTNTPLKHFHVIWPTIDPNISPIRLNYRTAKCNSNTLGTRIDLAK